MSQEFNFDIDKIANNAISKTDRTTEIIESTETQANGQMNFLEKLTPEQQDAIIAKAPQLVDNFISDHELLRVIFEATHEKVHSLIL